MFGSSMEFCVDVNGNVSDRDEKLIISNLSRNSIRGNFLFWNNGMFVVWDIWLEFVW